MIRIHHQVISLRFPYLSSDLMISQFRSQNSVVEYFLCLFIYFVKLKGSCYGPMGYIEILTLRWQDNHVALIVRLIQSKDPRRTLVVLSAMLLSGHTSIRTHIQGATVLPDPFWGPWKWYSCRSENQTGTVSKKTPSRTIRCTLDGRSSSFHRLTYCPIQISLISCSA